MKTLPITFALLMLCIGCKSVGPVTVRALEGGRQFTLKNETGQDLSGATTRGHIIWAGDVFAVPPESIGSWPAGAEIRTIQFHFPVSALVLHGFSSQGRFAVEWQESDRVLFRGRMVGIAAIGSVVNQTRVEVPIFGR